MKAIKAIKFVKSFCRKSVQIRAQSQKQNQIFQVVPPRNHVSINDVEDVLCATVNMDYKNKKDIFAANGIDYDKVDLYYDKVKQLDYLFDISENMPMSIPIHIPMTMHGSIFMAITIAKPMFNNIIHYTLCFLRFLKAFIIMLFHSM